MDVKKKYIGIMDSKSTSINGVKAYLIRPQIGFLYEGISTQVYNLKKYSIEKKEIVNTSK